MIKKRLNLKCLSLKSLGVSSDWPIPLPITRPSSLNSVHGPSFTQMMTRTRGRRRSDAQRRARASITTVTSYISARYQNEMNSTSAGDSCSYVSSPAEMPACYRDLCGGASNFANMPNWTLTLHTGKSYGI